MNIGLFTDSYPPYINGVSTSVYNLREALKKLGHTVYIVTVNDSIIKHEYDEKEKILRIPGIPIGIYDYRLSEIYPVSTVRIIKKWKLDVIHSHTEFGVGIFARILAKKFKIPLVHTYHTLYEDYTHYITHNHFNKLSKKIVKDLTKVYCVKTAKETIVPTDKIYKLFKEKYMITKNVSVIPSGIDIERFFEENVEQDKVERIKEKYGITKDDFTIIFVGRLAQEKNIEFLLNAQQKLIEKRINNIKLLIVGDGPDKENYINITRKLNIFDKVIFTGKIEQDKIQYYYQCADAFVTASNSETQGLTVIEAMAAGVVPICINDMAFIDMLPKKSLFNNQKEYINRLITFSTDEELRKEYKAEIRKKAEEYSSNTYAQRVLNVYSGVLNGGKKDNTLKSRELINEKKKMVEEFV
ncbi:MAG: glycosyltransferase [Clostridia bacterium]